MTESDQTQVWAGCALSRYSSFEEQESFDGSKNLATASSSGLYCIKLLNDSFVRLQRLYSDKRSRKIVMSGGQVRSWQEEIQEITKSLKYKSLQSCRDSKHWCSEYKSKALPIHESVGCIVYISIKWILNLW